MVAKKPETKQLAIMFIDLVNYTQTTSNLNRETFNRLHEVFDTLTERTVDEHSGKIIKKIGDAFLITFESPTEAVLAGINLQKEFKSKIKELKIRVAIHSGEVILRKGDIYGDAVNITARIESIAKSGHIVFSSHIKEAINKNEIPSKYIGHHHLKGIKKPLALYKVRDQEDLEKERKRKRKILWKKIKKAIFRSSILIILILIIWYVLTTVNFK